MKQRDVTDNENTTWSCVQAYSGLNGEAARQAAQLAEDEAGRIPVVCTPTGGAQSVRLELATNWLEHLSDDQLVDAIAAHQK